MSDSKLQQQDELKLLSRPLAFSVDGNSITLRDNNIGELVFFQINQKVGNVLEANGVATIRLTLDQMKGLRDLISNAVTDHEKRMSSNKK